MVRKRNFKPKMSERKLWALSSEEERTAKKYDRFGFKKQAKQEAQHAKFFRKLAEKGGR